jgi:hypothetical protein
MKLKSRIESTNQQRRQFETQNQRKPKMTKPKSLKSIEKKLKAKAAVVPVHEDPRAELKRLVKLHNTHTKNSVALHHMGSDRVLHETGDVIPCLLPPDGIGGRDELLLMSENQKKAATKLESAMNRELKKLPVYNLFLKNVYGVGPVVAGYLVANIDIRRAEKPSQLQRYCGVAVINGHFERRESGPKYDPQGNLTDAAGTFNQEIRTRLYQAFSSMWRTKGEGSSKYLDIWQNTKARDLLKANEDGKIESNGKMISVKGYAHSKGWHVAAQLFVYDLYLIWRAVEGLPSWTTWYDWARGYEHGRGPLPRENVPRMLTVEQAIDLIGYVGKKEAADAAE